jgi:methionyl aminopeptidase
MLPDHWTVVTKDHKLSAQWEHTILVTASGAEVLTHREEETLPRIVAADGQAAAEPAHAQRSTQSL